MPEIPLNIVDFVTRLRLLGSGELSLAQRTILKATYGLELNQAELGVYQRATGREVYEPREHDEATVIVGRRGGKTSRIAAIIATFEAFRDHNLPRGERANALLVAPVTKQAQIAFDFIKNYILGSPPLKNRVGKVRTREIELKNGITIACFPCSQITIRGLSVVVAICDELGFWRDEVTAANPAEEVLRALRPAMATFERHKLIKISTPYRKEGILWREHQERIKLEHLVWQLSSAEMNPTISANFLEKEQQRNGESFRREYRAEFTDHITGWIGAETLQQCVIESCTERLRVNDAVYAAAADPAFKRDDFAFAVAHRSNDGTIILDHTATWTGTGEASLGYEWVCREIARILRRYALNTLVGDQHCAAIIQQEFLKLGISYREVTFGAGTRLDIFGNLKHLFIQRKIELQNEPELLRQLRSLEEHKTPRGNIDILPSYGAKDDLAVAVALAAFQLSHIELGPTPFVRGEVERGRTLWIPGACPNEAVCGNFPDCLDEGACLGFRDLRPSLVSIQRVESRFRCS
jgi:hypothetical protein